MSVSPVQQSRSSEWAEQWAMFSDDERFLFDEWIRPATTEDFRHKDVLECGCGGGHHTPHMAEVARSVTAVDLNCADLARQRCAGLGNVAFVDADLATMDLGRQYDVVICIGVIHHTDDPDATFRNLYRHCKPGGRVIIWTYSAEGNALVRYGVEPVRKLVLRHLSRKALVAVASVVTALLYPIVYSLYLLPLKVLPYWEYFANFRRMGFERNMLNVFDKLNAPQTRFTTRAKAGQWMSPERFEPGSISIQPYVGVSWSLVGIKKGEAS